MKVSEEIAVGAGLRQLVLAPGLTVRLIAILNISALVGLSGLTMRNSIASGGAGILNRGTLTVNSSTLRGNMALSETSAAGIDSILHIG
jgi:hypothetical protein